MGGFIQLRRLKEVVGEGDEKVANKEVTDSIKGVRFIRLEVGEVVAKGRRLIERRRRSTGEDNLP